MLLIRRRRPVGEPAPAEEASQTLRLLEGTAGAGRICAALLELGIGLSGVRQAVIDADASIEDLDGIDLDDRFERVVLGSHLVNLPDAGRRDAFVRLAARHAAAGCQLLLEHHPVDWIETAGEVRAVPGGQLGMVDIERNPPFVSAVSVYDVGGRVVRQPFTARVLSEEELAATLEAVDFKVERRLGPTWLEGVPLPSVAGR